MSLIKDTKVTYIPGSPGSPGSPGTPPTPGHYISVGTGGTGFTWVFVDTGYNPVSGARTGYYVRVGTSPTYTRVYVPPSPGTPAIPPVPGTAAQTRRDFNLGWNAGAVSIAVVDGDVNYSVSIDPSVVGVVTGLNNNNEGNGYREIDFGYYFSQGKAFVYENGVAKTSAIAVTSSDVFSVIRTATDITYEKNASLVYTSAGASTGPVFADASLYSGGDAIKTASLTSSSSVTPVDVGGGGYGVMRALVGSASNKPYSGSLGELSPLGAEASSGELVPTYALASGTLQPVLSAAYMLTGGLLDSSASLSALVGLASNFPYNEARASLEALDGFSIVIPEPQGTAFLTISAPTVDGSIRLLVDGENGANLTAPMATLTAYCGANSSIKAPAPLLVITGTVTNMGNADLTGPNVSVSAYGTVTGTSNANLVFGSLNGGTYSVVGYSGAVCSVTLAGKPTVAASGTSGSVGYANITLPLFELVASGSRQNFGSANLIGPAATLGATAVAWIMAPAATLVAIGSATVAVSYEAYAVNMQKMAGGSQDAADGSPNAEVTHYTNYPFDRIVRYKNSYFGMNSTGLFLLEGSTDDGVPIPWEFRLSTSDFGSQQLKTIESLYLGGRMGATETVKVFTGEKSTDSYTYTTPRGTFAQNYRQKLGRGLKARYYAVGASGSNELALDSIEFNIAELSRKI